MRTTDEYLQHVLDAVNRITEYVAETSESDFFTDYKTQDAIIRQIEILGEAGKNVLDSDSGFEVEHPEIAREFHAARGMRNLLAHGYFDVDLKTVWNTATIDIPKIKETVTRILRPEQKDSSLAFEHNHPGIICKDPDLGHAVLPREWDAEEDSIYDDL
jgi:uncharacterized protein with HEPN domain